MNQFGCGSIAYLNYASVWLMCRFNNEMAQLDFFKGSLSELPQCVIHQKFWLLESLVGSHSWANRHHLFHSVWMVLPGGQWHVLLAPSVSHCVDGASGVSGISSWSVPNCEKWRRDGFARRSWECASFHYKKFCMN